MDLEALWMRNFFLKVVGGVVVLCSVANKQQVSFSESVYLKLTIAYSKHYKREPDLVGLLRV
jgi:hypothetical protein